MRVICSLPAGLEPPCARYCANMICLKCLSAQYLRFSPCWSRRLESELKFAVWLRAFTHGFPNSAYVLVSHSNEKLGSRIQDKEYLNLSCQMHGGISEPHAMGQTWSHNELSYKRLPGLIQQKCCESRGTPSNQQSSFGPASVLLEV